MTLLVLLPLLLCQEPQPEVRKLPDHVRLVEDLKPRAMDALQNRLARLRPQAAQVHFNANSQPAGPRTCATMIVIPTDASVDPKMVLPLGAPSEPMPVFQGIPPCPSK